MKASGSCHRMCSVLRLSCSSLVMASFNLVGGERGQFVGNRSHRHAARLDTHVLGGYPGLGQLGPRGIPAVWATRGPRARFAHHTARCRCVRLPEPTSARRAAAPNPDGACSAFWLGLCPCIPRGSGPRQRSGRARDSSARRRSTLHWRRRPGQQLARWPGTLTR